MFYNKAKKSEGHAGENDPEIDFAWLLYIGMNKFRYSEAEVGHMYYGKWLDLYECFKRDHNTVVGRMTYKEEQKRVSLLSI